MASPSPGTVTEIQWLLRTLRLGGLSVPIARVRTELRLRTTKTTAALVPEWAWLDTGAPLSVVPFSVSKQGLVWQPLAGVRVTWKGIPCDVGHINVWLTDLSTATLQGPYPMLAKFPQHDPPGKPVPVLLGLEFLLTHRAALGLDPTPRQGALRFP